MNVGNNNSRSGCVYLVSRLSAPLPASFPTVVSMGAGQPWSHLPDAITTLLMSNLGSPMSDAAVDFLVVVTDEHFANNGIAVGQQLKQQHNNRMQLSTMVNSVVMVLFEGVRPGALARTYALKSKLPTTSNGPTLAVACVLFPHQITPEG